MLGDYQLQFICNLVGVLMFMMIIVFHYVQANLIPAKKRSMLKAVRNRQPVPARKAGNKAKIN